MIRLVDEKNKNDLIMLCGSAAVSACRILCIYESYGSYNGLADFWLQYNADSESIAAIVKYSGVVTLYCTDKADISELRNFIDTIGFAALESETRIIENMDEAVIMQKSASICSSENIAYINDNPDYKGIYSLMESCACESFEIPSYADFITEFSHRYRHGTSKFCCAEKDRKIISFCMTAALTNNNALIGSVCSHPEYRHNGFGTNCLLRLAEELGSRNIFLLRHHDKNESFYKNAGFENCGIWYRARCR